MKVILTDENATKMLQISARLDRNVSSLVNEFISNIREIELAPQIKFAADSGLRIRSGSTTARWEIIPK